ncbi:XF1762 family protein [Paenibacillus ihuae]|uniref:XF1762 family protein n=1 Tax=Paenibacillus ihuae TaxID=1232431 RepID=UPI0009E6A22A|nr:XF1762 family protein [Paenibacillus ihuae]
MNEFLPTGINSDVSPVKWYWVFVHEGMRKYIVYSDDELTGERRLALHDEGFDLLWDSAMSRSQAVQYMRIFYPDYSTFEVIPTPISFRQACHFINLHHRHHMAPQGMKFALGMSNGQKLVGVLTAGRPVSRHKDDGLTLEVTRLCVNGAYVHLCSKLYAAARRIARDMGYHALITYTLDEETGVSVRAAGFQLMGKISGGSWNSLSRNRVDKHPTGLKKLWMLQI